MPAQQTPFISALETQIVNPLITLITLAAFVLFVWGVVEYIRGSDNEEKRSIGQRHIIWGIIGLVIIFAAHAIVSFLGNIIKSIPNS